MFFIFKKIKPDRYFLEEENSYTKKRKFNTGRLKVIVSGVSILAVTVILFTGSTAENRTEPNPSRSDVEARHTPRESHDASTFYEERLAKTTTSAPRNYGAAQIVRRGGKNGSTVDGLPMGTTIPVKLVNTVLSSDSDSPVIAEITDDVLWENQVIIPMATKAIGQGNLDDSTERLKCRFHTLVFPDGSQHAISGLALVADGSSGIPGDYHSQRLRKQSGKFLGDFIGGVAQGLKERRADGQIGITHEPGNLRNGVLNGVANSTLDYANSYSDDMKNIRPYLEVPGGSSFLIYLEKEYTQ